MSSDTTWHADDGHLAGYAAGRLGRAASASVDAHLVACSSCRAAVAPMAPSGRLDRNLAAIQELVDAPRAHPVERLLQRLGVPERITRLLVVTPSARNAWLAAVALVLFVAVVATETSAGSERLLFTFLVAAPLVPVAVVTATFATRSDPLREVVVAAPTPAFDLLLIRAVAVLLPTIVLAASASLLVPDRGWEALLWLLPSLGLTSATLALGSWFPVRVVAAVLATAWVAAALLSVHGVPRTALVEHYAAFRPVGQLALLLVTVLAGAVTLLRRDTYERIDAGRPA